MSGLDEELSDQEHIRIATEMYERWQQGEPKSRLEIEYWGNATAHGKKFTGYVKRWLNVETEGKSLQTSRIEELEALLRSRGISPTSAGDLAEEFRLLANARESALAAVRIYNDPVAGYRTETFVVLMVGAWNSLFQAILERDGIDYFERDESGEQVLIDGRAKVLGTWELVHLVLEDDEHRAVRANIDFFLKLRNQIAHRYLPALDTEIAGEAQAMLLNFEEVLLAEFGKEATLGEQLAVPLQLSGFRSDGSLASVRKAQARLPVNVAEFLTQHRAGVDAEVLADPKYCLRIFFVPVTANRERSADAVVRFVPPGAATPELQAELAKLGVVTKRKITPVASADLLRPKEVVNLVAERLPHRFTMSTHTACWKHYGVRPPQGAPEPEATDQRYCRWDRLLNGYGYTEAWVERLVRDLSNPETYEEVVGIAPTRR